MSSTNGSQTALDDTPERDALRSMLALRVLVHNFIGMSERRHGVNRLAFDVMVNDIFELFTMSITDIQEVINRGEIR